jgi:hypothetical protein
MSLMKADARIHINQWFLHFKAQEMFGNGMGFYSADNHSPAFLNMRFAPRFRYFSAEIESQ